MAKFPFGLVQKMHCTILYHCNIIIGQIAVTLPPRNEYIGSSIPGSNKHIWGSFPFEYIYLSEHLREALRFSLETRKDFRLPSNQIEKNCLHVQPYAQVVIL